MTNTHTRFEHLDVEVSGSVLIVRLNGGPHGMMGLAMAEELAVFMDRLEADASIDAVVFTGTHPGRFIGHADVRRMLLNIKAVNEASRTFATWVASLLDKAKYDNCPVSAQRANLLTPIAKAFMTDQGFDALIEKPTGGRECKRYAPGGYIEGGKIPLDPWDNEYIYESDGKTFTIISLGADNAEGGEGVDADINSKDL